MALTVDEEELYKVAVGGLPSWFFAKAGRREAVAAFAKQHDWIRRVIRAWIDQTFVGQTPSGRYGYAFDEYLDAHAADLGTRRQGGEGNAALRVRLQTFADALTTPALQGIADALLDTAGLGPSTFLKLRRDRVFLGTYPATLTDPPYTRAFLSCGYRIGSRKNEYVVMLPYGATDDVAAALDAALRPNEAAANEHLIEVRRNP